MSAHIDIESPYALFTLFILEEFIKKICNSTNLYAKIKQDKNKNEDIYCWFWKDIRPAELKVFLGILIYMGVHDSQQIDQY